jgi:hypothetical protein
MKSQQWGINVDSGQWQYSAFEQAQGDIYSQAFLKPTLKIILPSFQD